MVANIAHLTTEQIPTVATCDVCGVPARQHYDEAGRPTRRLCTTHAGPAGYCRLCHQLRQDVFEEPFVCAPCQAQLFREIMATPLTDFDRKLLAQRKEQHASSMVQV